MRDLIKEYSEALRAAVQIENTRKAQPHQRKNYFLALRRMMINHKLYWLEHALS